MHTPYTLYEIFHTLNPETDGASVKYAHYLDVYSRKFHLLKESPIKLLEIGIEKGGSLALWDKYFTHKDKKIIGADIVPGCKKHVRPGIEVFIGDQRDLDFLKSLPGPFDIIIDDGGHHTDMHIASFNYLFLNSLKEGGLYFIEDTHTCYMHNFNPPGSKTIMDFMFERAHNTTQHTDSPFDTQISSVEFHDRLIIVKKREIGEEHRTIKSPGFDSVPYPT